MKTRLLVFVTVLIAAFAAWYFFFKPKSPSGGVERLIPATSLGVLSIDNLEGFYSSQSDFDWWDELTTLPLLSNGLELLDMLDSLDIQSNLSELPIDVSFHITGNDRLESLYFIQSKGFDWNPGSLRTLVEGVFGAEESSFTERTYQDRSIHEVQLRDNSLSFFIDGEYLAISANALLVEDAVRAVELGNSLLSGVEYTLGSANADISLLLDCGTLDDIAGIFSTGSESIKGVEGLYVQMDIVGNGTGLQFIGRSIISPSAQSGESDLNLKNFVPISASSVIWKGVNRAPGRTVEGIQLTDYLDLHEGDLCLLKMDLNNLEPDKVVMASLGDAAKGEQLLRQLATSLMSEEDTLFRESFMETEIVYVNRPELPLALYGEGFEGFDQPYFTVFNDVLLFGSSIDVLKAVLAEYDDENTWGRSIKRRQYMDNLIQETNLTAIYNFEYLLESINEELKEDWKAFFSERSQLTNAIDLFSLQLSNTGASVLVNAALDFNQSASKVTNEVSTSGSEEVPVTLEAGVNVFADTLLSTPVFVVRNHNNGDREMVFQDKSDQLYLISDQGVVQWKKQIGQPVNGTISQIDYYNNRKLQYFFFTDSAMYLIDRNGDDVEGFPKKLNTELPLPNHRVVDYDNTRRYRYAGADRRGNVYLYNKEGELLEGWNPKRLNGALLTTPEHVRIRGRDCFLMVEAEGTVHLTNRRGEYYPGFPYESNKRLAGNPVISKGADFARSAIIMASENGELIGLNFEGSVLSRKQLLRPSANSRFQLIADRLNTASAVVRRDAGELVFFNQNGDNLFAVPARSGDELAFGFYNFRNDSELFVVRNITRGEVDIFNKNGQSILAEPLAAEHRIGIIYHQSRAEYELFINFADQMAVYSVRK